MRAAFFQRLLSMCAAHRSVPNGAAPIVVDTDCALDDLATLALAAATHTPLQLVTTSSGLAPPGHGHVLARRLLDALDLSSLPVVAGAEAQPPYAADRPKAEWELSYPQRLVDTTLLLGLESVGDEVSRVDAGSANKAAGAIVATARAVGGNVTLLALGALTNVARASEQFPTEFSQYVRRIVFIGDIDARQHSYNVALDPMAVRTTLRSGVELVLIGNSCYVTPAWVHAVFESCESEGRSDADECTPAERALRIFGHSEPHSFCYDPLALFFHLHEDAFELKSTPVRILQDPQSGWRFERCDATQRDGYVSEAIAVSQARYAAFLRAACAIVPP